MKKKLVIIQTATPDYRALFYDRIKEVLQDRFELYSGEESFETTVKTRSNLKIDLKNHFFLKRKFLFQTGIWHLLFKNNLMVFELNPRILSTWIFLVIRKIFNRETVLWGHAWPRKGKDSKSDNLRNLMRLLGSEIIVYTQQQKNELQQKMPYKKILAAPNALYKKEQMQVALSKEIKDLIYVGRLTVTKKVFFLVKAFHHSLPSLPENVNLHIVGTGEEENKIKEYLVENNLENRVFLYGHVSDYQKLKELYSQSVFSVSPGYVGLSITQSFGFGVPMLISKNENHSPEIEAAKENENALFFETDDMGNFRSRLQDIYHNLDYWITQRHEIVDFCQKEYSVESMAEVFINLLDR